MIILSSALGVLSVQAQTNIVVTNAAVVLTNVAVVVAKSTTDMAPGSPLPPPGLVDQLSYIVPLLAPIIIYYWQLILARMEVRVPRIFLPFACALLAVIMVFLLNMFSRLQIPPEIYGPMAGAMGIGIRELFNKGSDMVKQMPDVLPPKKSEIPVDPNGETDKPEDPGASSV